MTPVKYWNRLERYMNKARADNMTPLKNNAYIVRTQAGLRKALKEWFASMGSHGTFKDNTRLIDGYPKQYPSLVVFNFRYNGGGHTLQIDSINMELINKASEQEKKP